MEILGDRWTLLIVSEVLRGHRRFGEIQRHLGLARTVLTAKLALLVERGVLERRLYHEDPDWYEYHVTNRGRGLRPLITAIKRWERAHLNDSDGESP
jgi:DNA-binding HxlR family transcriptional regulator